MQLIQFKVSIGQVYMIIKTQPAAHCCPCNVQQVGSSRVVNRVDKLQGKYYIKGYVHVYGRIIIRTVESEI